MFTFNHYNYNVLDLEKSMAFYAAALGLKEVRRKEAPDGSWKLVYLGDGKSDFTLELTWLRDRKEPYNLGENEFHLAFQAEDFDAFLAAVKASGDSSFKYLQNVYTNHDITHQNVSVALAVSDAILGSNGVSRVHGGGFAGTIQAFVKNEAVAKYKAALDGVFGEGACSVLMIRKYGGMQVL